MDASMRVCVCVCVRVYVWCVGVRALLCAALQCEQDAYVMVH